jgi:hypothetical protein
MRGFWDQSQNPLNFKVGAQNRPGDDVKIIFPVLKFEASK